MCKCNGSRTEDQEICTVYFLFFIKFRLQIQITLDTNVTIGSDPKMFETHYLDLIGSDLKKLGIVAALFFSINFSYFTSHVKILHLVY